MAHYTKRGSKFWVRWREGGRGGINRSITVSTEREARRKVDEIEEAIERDGRYEPRRAGSSSHLSVILTDYVADCARRLRPGTVRNYAQQLELFRTWLPKGARAEDLSFALLTDYHVHLGDWKSGRHLHARSPNTIHKHLQIIEQMWEWAWKRQARGTYHGVPQPDSLELRREPAEVALAPTWAQMDAMIDKSTGWQRDLHFLLRCTGLRVQQAMRLLWDDVDLRQGKVHIRGELGKSTQERRGRWIPLAPVLVHELEGWGRREGYVLRCDRAPNPKYPGKEREARARDAGRAWKRAGVDPAIWKGSPHHSFRDGFVSGLKRLGADNEAVEYLVGHSRGIRDVYADPSALPLVEAVALVPQYSPPSKKGLTVHAG